MITTAPAGENYQPCQTGRNTSAGKPLLHKGESSLGRKCVCN